MSKEVTMENQDVKDIVDAIMKQKETINLINELSENSFKLWLFEIVTCVAEKMGLIVQGLYEFINDINYCAKSGFQAGREEARKRSLRRWKGGNK